VPVCSHQVNRETPVVGRCSTGTACTLTGCRAPQVPLFLPIRAGMAVPGTSGPLCSTDRQ